MLIALVGWMEGRIDHPVIESEKSLGTLQRLGEVLWNESIFERVVVDISCSI